MHKAILGAAVALLTVGLAAPAFAQDAALIEAAKKEGRVFYYTTRLIDAMNMFGRAFEAKYGIKVEASRHTNEDLVAKILNESRAGRPSADVFDGSSGMSQLMEAGLVAQYKPKEAEVLAAEFKDPNGYWTANNIYVAGLAYNTELVKEADLPKKVDDLLDPKWRGKVTYTMQFTVSGINGFFGALEKERGTEKAKEFITALHKNGAVAQNATPAAVLTTIASGQYPLCIGCNYNTVDILLKKGGPPIAMSKMQPMVTFFSAMGILKNAPNPNAARLFVEFMMSKEGQTVMEDTDTASARTDIGNRFAHAKPGPNTFPTFSVPPNVVAKDLPRWSQIQTEVRR